MEHRLMQPASREQIVAIIRQRAERNRDHQQQHAGGAPAGAAAAAVDDRRLRDERRAAAAAVAVALPPADPLAGPQFGIGDLLPPVGAWPRLDAAEPRLERAMAGLAGQPVREHALAPGRIVRERPPRGANIIRQAAAIPPEDADVPRTQNVAVDGDLIAHALSEDHPGVVGIYVSSRPMSELNNYFEVEILEKGAGASHDITIGLCSAKQPLDLQPGWASDSIGYHCGDGSLCRERVRGQPFGPACDVGDRVGCGVRFPPFRGEALPPTTVHVFFTRNGKEVGCGHLMQLPSSGGGLFPAVGFQQQGEEVQFRGHLHWAPEEDLLMLVDNGEDEWLRLHDVRLNTVGAHCMLEYVGRGKSLIDVGIAQAKTPIGTRNHYFEVEIVDPGLSCYIAIGLARKDYPKNRHPGWNKGSIAYHADDGKVFVGSGVGAPFGPRCHKGDIMGCGVLFPRNYECRSDSEEEIEQQGGGMDQYGGAGGLGAGGGHVGGAGGEQHAAGEGYLQPINELSDSGDDEDEWWNDRNCIQSGVKVEIYFTRNGKVVGKKEIRIPKGGFYPTIGMMSVDEKVRVDLRPLSG